MAAVGRGARGSGFGLSAPDAAGIWVYEMAGASGRRGKPVVAVGVTRGKRGRGVGQRAFRQIGRDGSGAARGGGGLPARACRQKGVRRVFFGCRLAMRHRLTGRLTRRAAARSLAATMFAPRQPSWMRACAPHAYKLSAPLTLPPCVALPGPWTRWRGRRRAGEPASRRAGVPGEHAVRLKRRMDAPYARQLRSLASLLDPLLLPSRLFRLSWHRCDARCGVRTVAQPQRAASDQSACLESDHLRFPETTTRLRAARRGQRHPLYWQRSSPLTLLSACVATRELTPTLSPSGGLVRS